MRIPFPLPAPGSAPFDVVGFGQNSVDLVTVVDHFPKCNTKQQVRRFNQVPGGQIATAVAVCARLGWKARYIGRFGADLCGGFSRESLANEGVDVEFARTIEGATNQFAVILVDAKGERTVLWHRDDALASQPFEFVPGSVTAGRVLIVDGEQPSEALQAARSAREAGIPTMVDVESVSPGVDTLLQHIDAIIAAEEFPRELTGHGDPGRALEAMARQFDAPVICVTLGEDGSLARSGGREIRTRGFPVEVVDSTGAGDAFRGGFAAGCLRRPEGDLEDALVYANAVAALNCRALGARGGIPTAADVERLIYNSHL